MITCVFYFAVSRVIRRPHIYVRPLVSSIICIAKLVASGMILEYQYKSILSGVSIFSSYDGHSTTVQDVIAFPIRHVGIGELLLLAAHLVDLNVGLLSFWYSRIKFCLPKCASSRNLRGLDFIRFWAANRFSAFWRAIGRQPQRINPPRRIRHVLVLIQPTRELHRIRCQIPP